MMSNKRLSTEGLPDYVASLEIHQFVHNFLPLLVHFHQAIEQCLLAIALLVTENQEGQVFDSPCYNIIVSCFSIKLKAGFCYAKGSTCPLKEGGTKK